MGRNPKDLVKAALWAWLSLAGAIAVGTLAADAGKKPAATLGDFAWLAGVWELKTERRTVTEMWMPPAGKLMTGTSGTVAGERTVEYEFMAIRQIEDGSLVFQAWPSGQPGAAFPLVSWDGVEAVFENMSHDFPQRIIYRRDGAGGLLAAIEGSRDGRTRRIEFPYKRVELSASGAPQSGP